MTYETLFARCTFLDCERVVPNKVDPIAHVTLGDAVDLCRQNVSTGGKISKESFKKIREFRERMADYDKKWGRK